MATSVTPATLKRKAPSFKPVSNQRVQDAIDEAARSISEKAWGARFDDGVFYLACHIMQSLLDAEGDGDATEGDAGAPAGPMTSERILSWSADYASPDAFNSAMATTSWGRIYLQKCSSIFAGRVI